MTAWTRGRLVGALVFFGLVVVYFSWGSVVQLSATDTNRDVGLWLYDSDVAFGDHVAARVRVESLSSARIRGVRIFGAGSRQSVDGEGDDVLDFDVPVPVLAKSPLELTIEVDYSTGFGTETATFEPIIDLYSRTESDIRRGVKALIAVASWFAVVLLDVLRRRWYRRRHRAPSDYWRLALAPLLVAGWFWSTELVEHASRLHGWWFVSLAMALWFSALLLAQRWTRYASTSAYVVDQVMMATERSDAFRGANVQVPVCAIGDLELAWYGAGFVVERVGGDLRLSLPTRGLAVIPVPASESLGGEPFELRASDRTVALAALAAISPLLGELRARAGGDELRVPN